MNQGELRTLKVGDKIRSACADKGSPSKTIVDVTIKELDGYTHCTFTFENNEKSFGCSHCNATMWTKD